VFRIGEFSRLSMVPVTALRYYADVGLLEPAHVDPDSGYRFFTAQQLPRVNRILALKGLGLSLDEIGVILDEELGAAELRGMLQLRRAELGRRVAEEQDRLERVEARLRLIEKEGSMPEREVVDKQVAPVRGVAMREVLATIEEIGPFIGDGFAGLGMAGIAPAGPPAAIYHDPEFTGEQVDVEIFLPVPPEVSGPLRTPAGRTLQERVLEGGDVVALVHAALYEEIGEAYQALGAAIAERGLRVAGPPRELYLTGPDEPGPPVTEIRFPVVAET